MVRVLSVHHFLAQDVTNCTKPVATEVAENLLLTATEKNEIEVRDLQKMEKIYKLSTIDTVVSLVYSNIGKYLATIENRAGIHFVRVYLNWRNEEALRQPVRTRIASVTPGNGQTEQCFEAVDISCGNNITGIGVCQSTGNLIMARENVLTIYKYSLATHKQTKSKYIDFQDCMTINLSYSPKEVRLAEDIIACLTKSMVHVFKIKLEVCSSRENALHSLSMYSFSSESEGGSMDPSPTKSKNINFSERIILNVTERRRKESSCGKESKPSVIRKHPGHILLSQRSQEEQYFKGLDRIHNPLVEKEQKEVGSLSSPNILETQIGPCETPLDINVTVHLVPKVFPDSRIQGTPLTLLYSKISETELNVERLHLLQISPVYWREYRVKRNKESNSRTSSSSASLHNPLQSVMYSHLMSFTFMFTSTFEGYLYHIPGHLRRVGKGVGVKKIGTYPFTSPVRNIVLEPSLLHALTDTGLETYTLRSGYHTVREAQAIDNKSNACPPTSTPICLIGLRPFLGVEALCIGQDRLVLLAAPEQKPAKSLNLAGLKSSLQTSVSPPEGWEDEVENWTIYSLHLPNCLDLYKDMVSVAEVNSGTPHAHLQLLCEAHMVLRNSLHRMTWLQVMKTGGGGGQNQEITSEQIEAVRSAYKDSCCKLADHYVGLEDEKCLLATPYYRMSSLPILSVLERFQLKTATLQEGVLHYIKELILAPVHNESIIENGVAEKIITILGAHSVDTLVEVLLQSPALCSFKSQTSLQCLEAKLASNRGNCSGEKNVELVVAAILVGGSGEQLTRVPPIQLSCVLLQRPNLLLDQPQNQSECFSDLSLALKHNVPTLFCELCASLVESNVMNLGQMLQLLLQTFMTMDSGASQENAFVLQFFLETYFVELISQNSQDLLLPLSCDQQQAVMTLLRSYLANLIHTLPATANTKLPVDDAFCVEPGESFGQRDEFLDLVSKGEENENLLKLESLLSSGICNIDCKQIVLRFLDDHPGLKGELSLYLLCTKESTAALDRIKEKVPCALLAYCKYRGEDVITWSYAVNILHKDKSQESKELLYSVLEELVTIFPAERLLEILPQDQDFQETIVQSRRNQRADQLQQLIVTYSIVAKI